MVCNNAIMKAETKAKRRVSQSPYEAKWFATAGVEVHYVYWEVSQSPYGAKWFATSTTSTRRKSLSGQVAIPLRGYVVCNLTTAKIADGAVTMSQSPHGAKWFATRFLEAAANRAEWVSQSPYGAKWFATPVPPEVGGVPPSQSPYGAKWFATRASAFVGEESAAIRSQSPYGAKWFATPGQVPWG